MTTIRKVKFHEWELKESIKNIIFISCMISKQRVFLGNVYFGFWDNLIILIDSFPPQIKSTAISFLFFCCFLEEYSLPMLSKFFFNQILHSQLFKSNYSFSLGTSFKQRSKLSEFFKNVHPDILGNAPVIILFLYSRFIIVALAQEKIKEENSRSLKHLNSYLDQLS